MIGYFYWGYLGDKKYNNKGEEVSTPDGNAFYSWSIINQLQKNGHKVFIWSNRDKPGYDRLNKDLFSSFATDTRFNMYENLLVGFPQMLETMKYAIIEWRWIIEGRNDENTKINNPDSYQPDRELMLDAIDYCKKNNVPFIIFDLDYKLTEEDIKKYDIKYVIELGDKWKNSKLVKSMRVEIPFDFTVINEKPIKMNDFTSNVIYIGNRYERDWCVEKYLPDDTVIHGNWLESGRQSDKDYPQFIFRKRLNASEIFKPYNGAVCTVLLAKKEYCEMGFMTARLIESIFYGTVPLFPEEFGDEVIQKYAGKYWEMLKVKNKDDVSFKSGLFRSDVDLRKTIIYYLRKHLRFMDSKFFINDIGGLINNDIKAL